MKRFFVLILTLLLVFSSVSALAETWTCPKCGAASHYMMANYCGHCGAKNPSPRTFTPGKLESLEGNWEVNSVTGFPAWLLPVLSAITQTNVKVWMIASSDDLNFHSQLGNLLTPLFNNSLPYQMERTNRVRIALFLTFTWSIDGYTLTLTSESMDKNGDPIVLTMTRQY